MNKIIEQIEKIKQINSNENLVIFVGAGVPKNSGVAIKIFSNPTASLSMEKTSNLI